MTKKFFGKYRGSVLDNADPQAIGRLQVHVPSLAGSAPAMWAMPSFACAGHQMGVWALPAIGTGVWVEFEEGDRSKPIWTGAWFASPGDVPAPALAGDRAHPSIVLQTARQNCIILSDVPGPAGGIVIKTASGAMLSISEAGITIANGKGAEIKMSGPTVSINNDALAIA